LCAKEALSSATVNRTAKSRGGEKRDDVLDAALIHRERVQRIAHKQQIALDDALRAQAD
jgi:hypothetical protein